MPAGQGVIHRLVPGIDLVTINYRPGVSKRLGIDYDTLRQHNESLLYCEITGFGDRGPMAGAAGTAIVANAYSGLMMGDQKLDENGLPLDISSLSLADYATGFSAVIGICSALYHRARTGEGQRIDASLLRSAVAIQDTVVMREPMHDVRVRDPMVAEVVEVRERGAEYREVLAAYTRGRRAEVSAFRGYYGSFQASDGAFVIGAVTPPGRQAARRVLGITDDPTDEPGFDTNNPADMDRVDRVQRQIRERIRTRTVSEWIEAFLAAGVPVSPINMPEEAADDPQVEALGIMADLDHARTGPQRVAGPIVELSATPTRVRGPAPLLGVDADDLLTTAGFDQAEIDALRADEVIR